MQKNINIIELNEFHHGLLKQAVKDYPLVHLEKALQFKTTQYKTNDRYNSGYLEPWVQWVSIHTSHPSKEHQIKHLGDMPDCQFKPIWQTLSELDITTGVWGVMNGARGQSPRNHFFFPDPWSFSEKASPVWLNGFLELPRYLAKNYQDIRKIKAAYKALGLVRGLMQSNAFFKILREIRSLRKALKQFGFHHFVFISWFDYIVTLLFCELKDFYRPQVNILFLNSLAHLQHHHWTSGEQEVTKPILHGLIMIDKALGHYLSRYPEGAYVFDCGLDEMNSYSERQWVLYRQKDPMSAMVRLGLSPKRVEQHMTHDGHAFFESEQACIEAFDVLKSIKVNDKALFLVELNEHDKTKLFYQLAFTDKLDKQASITLGAKSIPFFEIFDEIVTRTGRHIPKGTILSNEIHFADHIFNHEFNDYLLHYLRPGQFPIKADYLEDQGVFA